MNRSHPAQVELVSLFRFCQVIRWLMLAFILAQIVLFVFSWASAPLTIGPIQMQFAPDETLVGKIGSLSATQRWAGIVVGLPALVALAYGIHLLGKTLNSFQRGRIFTADTISSLRGSAGATLLSIVLFIVEKPLRGIAFNLFGNGVRYPVSAEVTSNELLLILVCSLFYLISGLMHEGRRLSEENEGFI
jgi:hypothetical protein